MREQTKREKSRGTRERPPVKISTRVDKTGRCYTASSSRVSTANCPSESDSSGRSTTRNTRGCPGPLAAARPSSTLSAPAARPATRSPTWPGSSP